MKRKVIIMIFITITIVLCGLYLHYENTKLQVSNYKIVNNNIPVDFNNYKIVQISDFHNNQSNTLTNDLIKEIEKQKQFQNSLFKITHEIKNPIAVCKGYLDMFDVNNQEHSKKYIPILKEEIERLKW